MNISIRITTDDLVRTLKEMARRKATRIRGRGRIIVPASKENQKNDQR